MRLRGFGDQNCEVHEIGRTRIRGNQATTTTYRHKVKSELELWLLTIGMASRRSKASLTPTDASNKLRLSRGTSTCAPATDLEISAYCLVCNWMLASEDRERHESNVAPCSRLLGSMDAAVSDTALSRKCDLARVLDAFREARRSWGLALWFRGELAGSGGM